jgi:ADP-heptose:LPS heptosyltransferase
MERVRRILVFRVGLLGDTIVALPSLHALRDNFPEARITLLHERPSGAVVQVEQLLNGSGLVGDYLTHAVLSRSRRRVATILEIIGLLFRLRWRRFDLLVHLAPSNRTPRQDARDRLFFRLAGIRKQITTSEHRLPPACTRPLPAWPQEADFLLSCLGQAGLKVPSPGQGVMDLHLGAAEDAEVARWEQANGLAGDTRPRVAFGPGSKRPATRWPVERYEQVMQHLVRDWGIVPVVFGGPEDAPVAEKLLAACGQGFSACGRLSLRGAARALRDCLFYVGNDTGTMHLAAAAGIPCVAIFSARNPPGKWFPYGSGHRVHRVAVSCEGCHLDVCEIERMRCLTAIEPREIIQSCEEMLRGRTELPGFTVSK